MDKSWPSPRIANEAIELIKKHGERVHTALAGWDYRRARRELALLIGKLGDLDPAIFGELSETEPGARPQSKVQDGR